MGRKVKRLNTITGQVTIGSRGGSKKAQWSHRQNAKPVLRTVNKRKRKRLTWT